MQATAGENNVACLLYDAIRQMRSPRLVLSVPNEFLDYRVQLNMFTQSILVDTVLDIGLDFGLR